MNQAELLRAKLDQIVKQLPKKLQFEYRLCKDTEELITEAARILKRNREKVKQQIFSSINSQEYIESKRKTNPNYKPSGQIYGLSTNPILLNYSCSWKTLVVTLLHEIGHKAGLLRKKKNIFSEHVADKIAFSYYKKICIKDISQP